jgi:hypothetical protein
LEALDRPFGALNEIKRTLKRVGVLGVACVEYGGLILAAPHESFKHCQSPKAMKDELATACGCVEVLSLRIKYMLHVVQHLVKVSTGCGIYGN